MRKSTGKAKIVAYMVWRNLYKEKTGQGESVRKKKGIWKFSVTILRPFTFARTMLP